MDKKKNKIGEIWVQVFISMFELLANVLTSFMG